MTEVLFVYSLPVIIWAAVAYKLQSHLRARRRLGPSQRDLLLTLSFLGLGAIVVLPPVHLAIDVAVGVPNLARLLGNGLVLLACSAAQAFFVRMTEPEARAVVAIRWYRAVLIVALVLLVAFFAAASLRDEALDFTRRFADAPFILEYKLVFLTYFGLALANISHLAWRYGRIATNPALRLGLLLNTLGGVSGLLYALNDGAYVVGRRLALPYPLVDPVPVTQALLFLSAACFAVGSTLPEWGQRAGVPALYRWCSQYRSLRRLYPLWLTLCAATPEIALVPPQSPLRDALATHDLDFRLYRRVVEIRDGALALRPYRAAWIERLARELCKRAGLAPEDTEVAVEAACLAAAVRLKREHRRLPTEESAMPPSTQVTQGGADLASEVALLERVAERFERSPIVRTVLARLDAAPAGVSPSAPTQSEQSAAGS